MKKLMGWMGALALISAPAFAGGDKPHEGKGGSGMTEMSAAETKDISGKVLKVAGNTVYVEHMGAAVPIEVSNQTTFEGDGLKSKKDLKKGQDIRASFTIKNDSKNVAQSISAEGTGGAYQEGAGTGGAGQETGAEGETTFDTGDVSDRSPGTIPEGNEPGPGAPMPESETY